VNKKNIIIQIKKVKDGVEVSQLSPDTGVEIEVHQKEAVVIHD
jgi:hypothetical protein